MGKKNSKVRPRLTRTATGARAAKPGAGRLKGTEPPKKWLAVMDAMDGASAADNGSGAGAGAVASPPPSAGLAAASAGAGVVTNTSSEMAPTPVAAVAGNASGTAARAGSEGPQAEAEEVQKTQAVVVLDAKCDDDREGRPAVDVPPPADVQDGADGEVQKDSSSVKHGTATASVSHEESASTPIAGAAEIPAVEDVSDASGACKVREFDSLGRLLIFSIVPSHSHIYPSPHIIMHLVRADIEVQERRR